MSTTGLIRRLLVLISCLFLFHKSEGFVTKTPQNVVVKKGESATLNCSTNVTLSTGQNPIEWKYDNTIIVHRPCFPPSGSKFVVSPSDSAADCNIRALASPDGISGVYTCSTWPFSRAKNAVATVIVVDPECKVVEPVVEGRRGTLMCRMTYEYHARARQFVHLPNINVSLSWTGVSGTTVRTTADPHEFSGTLETNMTVDDVTSKTVHSQICTITFNFSPGVGLFQYAVNTLSYPCQPTPLSSYCPTNVTVSPSSGPYKAGDVLTCKSDGFPEPSYTWTDSNRTIVAAAKTTTWRQGWSSLTCTATGNFTTPCSENKTVEENNAPISGDGGNNSRLIGIVFGVIIGLLLLLALIVVIVVICRRRRRKGRHILEAEDSGDGETNVAMSTVDSVGTAAYGSTDKKFDSMNGGLDHDLGDGASELSRSSAPTSSNYGGRGGLPRVHLPDESDEDAYTETISQPGKVPRSSGMNDGRQAKLDDGNYAAVDHRARRDRPDA